VASCGLIGTVHSNFDMPKFVIDFGSLGQPPEADGRLDGPAFHRNHGAIWAAIGPHLGTLQGDVLEVGSGTGQHATEFARRAPQLTWWPSDILPAHLTSIAAWGRQAGLANLRAPQQIDLNDPDWAFNGGADRAGALAAILCINVLHISPWRVSQNLMAGAGRLLRPGGLLFIYGAFKRSGVHTTPSNEKFDLTLRAENPDWGVRDINDLEALARQAGLALIDTQPMPANNLVLVFAHAARQNS
jgi:SAM-dependent methyltransferase